MPEEEEYAHLNLVIRIADLRGQLESCLRERKHVLVRQADEQQKLNKSNWEKVLILSELLPLESSNLGKRWCEEKIDEMEDAMDLIASLQDNLKDVLKKIERKEETPELQYLVFLQESIHKSELVMKKVTIKRDVRVLRPKRPLIVAESVEHKKVELPVFLPDETIILALECKGCLKMYRTPFFYEHCVKKCPAYRDLGKSCIIILISTDWH